MTVAEVTWGDGIISYDVYAHVIIPNKDNPTVEQKNCVGFLLLHKTNRASCLGIHLYAHCDTHAYKKSFYIIHK